MIDRRRKWKPDLRRVAEMAARAKQMERLDPAPPSEGARLEVEEERAEAHRVWIRRGCAWKNLNAAERSLLCRYPEAMDDDRCRQMRKRPRWSGLRRHRNLHPPAAASIGPGSLMRSGGGYRSAVGPRPA